MPDAPRDWIDRPKPVRTGEALDERALAAFLREHVELDGDVTVEQFPSGFSNLTYLVRVGERDLVLRRPPFGANVKGGHDMEREFTILQRLHGRVPVPEPLAFDGGDVLGAPCYLMERVRGVILRGQMPPAMQPDPATMAGIADAFVDTFADLHSLDLDAAGLADFGQPEGYVQRQVDGWTRRYQRAKTDDVSEIDRVAAWLDANLPPESGVTLIHNDYKCDNLVLDAGDCTRVRAVLDWEMATVGDPLMDLGSTLGYWVEPDDSHVLQMLALSPTTLPGNPTREALVARYERATGRTVEQPVFYYVYGLFKLAVIVQQIYKRYVLGHTADERFAGLIHAVRVCGQTAERAIERGRISGLG
ncbi:MAG: phosphotransferase family protein [Rhodothermales bacterium]